MPDQAITCAIAIPSPLGPLTLVATPAGLRAVSWHAGAKTTPSATVGRGARAAVDRATVDRAERVARAAADQLAAYFAGERTAFDLPLDPVGTPFQRRAWGVLHTIPFGATISYAEQARRLGDPRKARAVGGANGRNPLPIVVPCHRVIGSGGALVGFAAGIRTKAWLLRHERAIAAARVPSFPTGAVLPAGTLCADRAAWRPLREGR